MDLPGAPTSGDACSSKHRQVLARTPIVLSELLSRLANYPLRDDAMILAEGFERGFTLGCASQISPRTAPNLPSIAANKLVARELIREEIAAGRVAGPFKHPPIKGLVCSPIGLVPKSTPGKFRLIHHLSWPRGSSINDGIDPHNGHVTYSSFDSIVDKIMHMGRKTALAKVDIRSAFRLLPVRPEDYHLLGFRFECEYYYDMAMPFGCRSSCKTFERFAKFLNWCIMQDCQAGSAMDHYLDDFLAWGKPNTSLCKKILRSFQNLCVTLGVPLASDKIEGPQTVIRFLGLIVDTDKMEIRIPADKIEKALKLVDIIIARRKVTLQCLQSVIGSLSFLCRGIRPGRAFLQRMIALTRGVRKLHHSIRVSRGAKCDAIMWKQFLVDFNGCAAFLPSEWQDNATLRFYTDASLTRGYGAYFAGHWFRGSWPTSMQSWSSIAVCELIPIVLAFLTWGTKMRNRKVLIYCDNQAVKEVLNKQSSRCSVMMTLVRILTLECLKLNILIRCVFVPSFSNQIADALSRNQLERFRALAPEADQEPTPTPRAHTVFCALK